MDDGWSIKRLIRQIVLSRAYQLDSTHDPRNFEADPDNALVWRMSKHRLEAEAIRDALLFVGGRLIVEPPVGSAVAQAGEGLAGPIRRFNLDASDTHRSVYLPVVRDQVLESLALFDFADPSLVTGERATTTGPAQALYFMNSPFVIRQAEAAADRLRARRQSDDSPRSRPRICDSSRRPPTAAERARALAFLRDFAARARRRRPRARRLVGLLPGPLSPAPSSATSTDRRAAARPSRTRTFRSHAMNIHALSRRDAAEGASPRGSATSRSPGSRRSHRRPTRRRKSSPLAPKAPHFPARAKRVIFLCMNGAPVARRHVRLQAASSRPTPASRRRPGRLPGAKLLGSPWKFRQHGQSGLWVSELFPEVAAHADELCVIRSMHTDLPAHPQAYLMLHTGSSQFIRPSLGAWTLYGLGTENENLPGFIAIKPVGAQRRPAELRQRVPAGGLPGDPHRQRGRSPSPSAQLGNIKNPRLDAAVPAAPARPRPGDEPRAARARAGPPRRRGGHRVVRAGLPHARAASRA